MAKAPKNLVEALILLSQQQDEQEAIDRAELVVQQAALAQNEKGGR